MTTEQIEARLKDLGATAWEASLLSEVMYLNGWHVTRAVKPSNQEKSDMTQWLADFREERTMIANNISASRKAHADAGYITHKCNHVDTFLMEGTTMRCVHCGYFVGITVAA